MGLIAGLFQGLFGGIFAETYLRGLSAQRFLVRFKSLANLLGLLFQMYSNVWISSSLGLFAERFSSTLILRTFCCGLCICQAYLLRLPYSEVVLVCLSSLTYLLVYLIMPRMLSQFAQAQLLCKPVEDYLLSLLGLFFGSYRLVRPFLRPNLPRPNYYAMAGQSSKKNCLCFQMRLFLFLHPFC